MHIASSPGYSLPCGEDPPGCHISPWGAGGTVRDFCLPQAFRHTLGSVQARHHDPCTRNSFNRNTGELQSSGFLGRNVKPSAIPLDSTAPNIRRGPGIEEGRVEALEQPCIVCAPTESSIVRYPKSSQRVSPVVHLEPPELRAAAKITTDFFELYPLRSQLIL